MPRAALPGQYVKRLQRLLTLVQDLEADPRQPPEALWASLGISRAMFYKDRQALAALGCTFHYDRRQQRLFLPEAWFTDAYAARLTTCNIPWELAFQSKPQLAAAMVQAITREGLLPFKYVVADRLYGNNPDFLDALDACVGVTALVADPSGDALLEPAPPDDASELEIYRRSAFAWIILADYLERGLTPTGVFYCRSLSVGRMGTEV